MKGLSENAIRFARVLVAIVFVLNAIGVIDQTIPAKEMMERGVPAAIVPWFMLAGRTLEFIAGFALVLGVFPRSSVALIAFLSGAIAGGRMASDVPGRHWVSRALLVEALLLAFGAASALAVGWES